MTDKTTPQPKPARPDLESAQRLLMHAQNWVCDGCGYIWWQVDAYVCPSCGKSNMHRWGDRADEQ